MPTGARDHGRLLRRRRSAAGIRASHCDPDRARLVGSDDGLVPVPKLSAQDDSGKEAGTEDRPHVGLKRDCFIRAPDYTALKCRYERVRRLENEVTDLSGT